MTVPREDAAGDQPGGDSSADEPSGGEPAIGARPGHGESDAEALRERARHQRYIDEVFGDVLPSVTSDERAPGQHGGFSRAHYDASRPPHWGVKQ